MSYAILHLLRRGSLISLILAGIAPVCAAPVHQDIAFSTANELMAAVGKIKLTTAQLENSLTYCPAKFPHLSESAKNASTAWHKDNQAVLEQTELVNRIVIASVKQHASAFIAEKMALDMDALVSKSVQQLGDEFAARPVKEQHYLCNRLILSIATGKRNLLQQDPDETQRLMDFKQ
jgi:hypothetical protein